MISRVCENGMGINQMVFIFLFFIHSFEQSVLEGEERGEGPQQTAFVLRQAHVVNVCIMYGASKVFGTRVHQNELEQSVQCD